jgi:EAL domain-containing protein (putative c-di-GMP-specific phosphodiesterase class I)
MKVVAEGIETSDQLARLNRLNCEFGQGYFFSKPLEADKAEKFIDGNFKKLPSLTNQPVINLQLNM